MIRRLAAAARTAAVTPVVWALDLFARSGDDALADPCPCGDARNHHHGAHAPYRKDPTPMERSDARKRRHTQEPSPVPGLDLTPIVEAASAAFWNEYPDVDTDRTWDELGPMEKFALRNLVLPIINAITPTIATQTAISTLQRAAVEGSAHFAATHREPWARGRSLVTTNWLLGRAEMEGQ